MSDEELNALVKQAMDRAIERLQKLHSHAGRPAWDQVICEELSKPFTTLRAQLAEANARADRAEAALAAPEVMHEDAPAAIIGEIGNQIHNLGCELQNDEDVSLRLSDLACRLWDAAKLFPTEPTALDRMLADSREKALREAAQVLTDEIDLARIAMPQVVPILAADRKAILALIEKPQCV